MDKIEALAAMLNGKYIRAARYGGQIYFYDNEVDKFCSFCDDRKSMRFTDINALNNGIELAMFSSFEDAVKYAESNENKG